MENVTTAARDAIKNINAALENAKTQDEYNEIAETICRKKKITEEFEVDALSLCAILVEHVCTHFRNKNLDSLTRLISLAFEPVEEDIYSPNSHLIMENKLDKEIMDDTSSSLAKQYQILRTDLKYNFIFVISELHSNIAQFSHDEFMEKIKDRSANIIKELKDRPIPSPSDPKTARTSVKFKTREEIAQISNPVNIRKTLDKKIIGQASAKISMSVALSSHLLSYYNKTECQPNVSLLIGPTGSGKTLLAKELSAYSDLPIVFFDSSQITREGWRGLDKSTIMQELEEKTSSRRAAEYGIVVLDEFDKACFQGHSSRGDDVGEENQSNYLALFDGSPIRDSYGRSYKTNNLMFILTGAFTHLDEYTKENRKIGFYNEEIDTPSETNEIRQILVQMGIIPEMVGRITNIVHLSLLDENEAYKAIFNPASDFMKHLKECEEQTGKKIYIDKPFVFEKIKMSLETKLGVRGCVNILKEILTKAIYYSYETNSSKIVIEDMAKKESAN